MHKFRNLEKAYKISNTYWDKCYQNNLLELRVTTDHNGVENTSSNEKFINLCSCSYLGLNRHGKIIDSAIAHLKEAGTVVYPTSRCRIANKILDTTEKELGELFSAKAVLTISCAAATLGVLPLLASGILGPRPDIMLFDRFAHFSLAFLKPICGDETKVEILPHNDMEKLEEYCEKYNNVAYVADGAYSMGGKAPVGKLLELNKEYNLALFFDDSHSLSIYGRNGEGLVRNQITGQLPENVFIVASLGKAFGASGGVLLCNEIHEKTVFDRFGGPMSWSQSVNHAGLGAIRGSIRIHKTPELKRLQDRLSVNLDYFDSRIKTRYAGDSTPIRLVELSKNQDAVECAKHFLEQGFYVSAVFFPIIAKGKQGLRIMPRADVSMDILKHFCDLLEAILK